MERVGGDDKTDFEDEMGGCSSEARVVVRCECERHFGVRVGLNRLPLSDADVYDCVHYVFAEQQRLNTNLRA